MNDVWIVDSRRIAEFMLAAITVGAVVLLVLETVYLVIFTVFIARSTRARRHRLRKNAAENVTVNYREG